MLKINVEYSFETINYIQIGLEDSEEQFSGIVIDNTEILFINNNMLLFDSDGKSPEYEHILNNIIEKLETFTIFLNPYTNKYSIRDLEKFKSFYIKHFFCEDIFWMDTSQDILELTKNKKNEFEFFMSVLKKIDEPEYLKLKG